MHSLLDLQTNRTDPNQDQSLEQGLRQSSFRSDITHDNGSELTTIADHDELFGSHRNRDRPPRLPSLAWLRQSKPAGNDFFSNAHCRLRHRYSKWHPRPAESLVRCGSGAPCIFSDRSPISFFKRWSLENSSPCRQRPHNVRTEVIGAAVGGLPCLGSKADGPETRSGNLFCKPILITTLSLQSH